MYLLIYELFRVIYKSFRNFYNKDTSGTESNKESK